QKIMYVSGSEDLSKEVSKWSSSDSGSSEEYAIQYAWDKQANFLNAQSRAMSTLSNLIKQFVAIADEQDERRKKLELIDAQIMKIKHSIPDNESISSLITIIDSWSESNVQN
ncbi:hypothetical protein KUC01_002560, partial [Enterococcus faecium]|nr:hypothetical protein [Enterococcus faecium]